jgi:hypothetical protein
MVRDAYQLFFEKFIDGKKHKFFEFGLEQTIFADANKSKESWESLKYRLNNNEQVYIRRYGTGGRNTHLYIEFYEYVFNNSNIKSDPTNNKAPRKLLEEMTGYMKRPNKGFKKIQNYQISHVFGRTKNALAFTAPWNIVYLPKLLDPFTGHEAKGDDVVEFTKLFQKQCFDTFEGQILDFNEIMQSDKLKSKLADGIETVAINNQLTEKQKKPFAKSVNSEFAPIELGH